MMTLAIPRNEPVRAYAPGSTERASLQRMLGMLSAERAELALTINGRKVETGKLERAIVPHRHDHVLAHAHLAGPPETASAIAAAKGAARDWSRTSWEMRARVFLKAADLASGPWRDRLNAATMLGQSKTVHQAEIDAAAELADFLRFNVHFMTRLYAEQPLSAAQEWNRVDYRPLEGFVYAVTPFNFTAIAANLASAPAIIGATVVWKPSPNAKLAAHVVMELFQDAGLPNGVINLVYGEAAEITDIVLGDPDLAGINFTGSTAVFDTLRRATSARAYRNIPRLVGETGSKNFTLAHPSADADALLAAIIRGGFEYQGQKCSATSRVFCPRSLWPDLRTRLLDEIASIRVGDVADFTCFMGAVIDQRAWRRHADAIAEARGSANETVLTSAVPDDKQGYFVPPTLIETTDARSRFMKDELFGPIVTAYVYDDNRYDEMLDEIDRSSVYGLTGALFARDGAAVGKALDRLRYAAGNFYINDKSTGAVVGQQPFGGARQSGTNDKAGSLWNLTRWVSPRTIKENFTPPTSWRYPSMASDT